MPPSGEVNRHARAVRPREQAGNLLTDGPGWSSGRPVPVRESATVQEPAEKRSSQPLARELAASWRTSGHLQVMRGCLLCGWWHRAGDRSSQPVPRSFYRLVDQGASPVFISFFLLAQGGCILIGNASNRTAADGPERS